MTDTRLVSSLYNIFVLLPLHLGHYLGSCISPKWKIYVAAHRRPTNCIWLSLLRDIKWY